MAKKKDLSNTTFSREQQELDKKKIKWNYDDSPLLHLSQQELVSRCGLDVPEGELNRIESMIAESLADAFGSETRVDWRDHDGNYITEIKDQGNCGSCVSFATVAVLEAQARIEHQKPNWKLDLSEADLFFCGAGKRCGQGWWPTFAMDFVHENGIGEESYFPYQDYDMDCQRSQGQPEKLLKIDMWQEVLSRKDRQDWLATNGPLVACMAVYRDFFMYKNGVYRHEAGELTGYHAVCCVGYDNEESCWICKNSWGKEWGDNGFFKIEYGQAMIDTNFAMYGVKGISGIKPEEEEEEQENQAVAEQIVIERDAVNNQHILWAYAGGAWRYLIMTDSQTAAVSTSLYAANNVNIYYKDNKILRHQAWK